MQEEGNRSCSSSVVGSLGVLYGILFVDKDLLNDQVKEVRLS